MTAAVASKPDASTGTSGDRFFDQYFDSLFFQRSDDPFGEMRHVRDQLLNEMKTEEKNIAAFDRWFAKKYGGSVEDIRQREDRKHYYYDIFVKDMKNEKIGTAVKNGEITIQGSLAKKLPHGTETTHFERTFPEPKNIDANHVEIERGNGKITVKFAKRIPE
jgi:HSP20 family molecular chaperone IbpA